MTRPLPNLLASPDGPLPEELTEVLLVSAGVRIERIVSHGHRSAAGFWYRQAEHEWVAVLAGAARLTLREPDETLELGPGDHLHIEAGRPHRVDWTAEDRETIWVAVFHPVGPDP